MESYDQQPHPKLPQYQYESGLEVSPYGVDGSALPESVALRNGSHSESLPEVFVPNDTKPDVLGGYKQDGSGGYKPVSSGLEVVNSPGLEVVNKQTAWDGNTQTTWDGRSWLRRRWGRVCAALVLFVAVVVGVTVGVKSVCSGKMCPQILSATAGMDNKLFLFGRGTDNSIYYTQTDTTILTTSASPANQTWTGWTSLGGPFLSQPISATWNYSGSISVAAVQDPWGTVRINTFNTSLATTRDSWVDIDGDPSSALTMCTIWSGRLDLWSAVPNSTTVAHDFYTNSGGFITGAWQDTLTFGENVVGRPALACRSPQYQHDLVVYGATTHQVMHSVYNGDKGQWSPSQNRGGEFQGDPVVVGTDTTRIDFFGIGTDAAMHHFSWTNSSGYTSLVSLGGSFESVPAAVATGNGSRIDVLGLGTNDTLLHRAMDVASGTWYPSDGWEDLGVFANSAPGMVNLSSPTTSQPEAIAMFVVGYDGSVNQSSWLVGSLGWSWMGLNWTNLGGNMTTNFFRSGS